jgi:small-conductance mechanosensitive channel
MIWLADLLGGPPWPFALILGYPIVTMATLEFARRLDGRSPFTARVLRQAAYVLLPTGAIWLILRALADLPPENEAVRVAETAFALTGLYSALNVTQSVLISLADEKASAPKLLLDLVRIGLALLWGAVVVSNIWHVDLGSLIAAMGVGSIVLGFALQEFLGNLLSGLGLLSAHKFGIGDWIMVDGRAARVVEMDWRTVTLVDAGDARIVVANSTLAKGNLVIAARANQTAWASVPLNMAHDVPPEQVRDAALEAAALVPGLLADAVPKCRVVAITEEWVSYSVLLPVANPGVLAAPRDEFLSRFWYVAQRRGLRLAGALEPTGTDAASRRCILEQIGAFHRSPELLTPIAAASTLRRYRRGDVLLTESAVAADALLVAAGTLAVFIGKSEGRLRLETVGTGQLLVLQEMLTGVLCPVRVIAETDADVLAVPCAVLADASRHSTWLTRDIGALTEARRQAIVALQRGARRIA